MRQKYLKILLLVILLLWIYYFVSSGFVEALTQRLPVIKTAPAPKIVTSTKPTARPVLPPPPPRPAPPRPAPKKK